MSIKRFIITGTQRVGSSTISNSLSYHQDIACGWQWPDRVTWSIRVKACRLAMRGDFRMLAERHRDHMATEYSENTTCLGYRNLFRANDIWVFSPMAAFSLYQDRFYANMAWWQSEPDIHIIHIVRTDNLAWLRSKFVARKLNSFGAGNQYSDEVTVVIPVYRALKRLQMKHWLDQTLGELARSNPYHVIRYEDLLIDRNTVIQNAQQFLGLEPELIPEVMISQRQSKGIPIEKHIRNFSQLEEALDRASLLTAPIPGVV